MNLNKKTGITFQEAWFAMLNGKKSEAALLGRLLGI